MTKTPPPQLEQQSLVAELERLEPGILMEINPAAGMKLTSDGGKGQDAGLSSRSAGYIPAGTRVYIELKRQKGGSLSPEQKARIPRLEAAGYRVIVARGAKDALISWEKLGLFS